MTAPVFGLIKLRDWNEARQLTDLLRLPNDTYIFRGQRRTEWKLESTLERLGPKYVGYDWMTYFNKASKKPEKKLPKSSLGYRDLKEAETRIIEKFKKFAGIYLTIMPSSKIEWLSWIQHYGGPTRLLDFTYSFYVAVFLAIENAEEDAAVYAVKLAETMKWPDRIKKERNIENLTLEELDAVLPIAGVLRAEPKNMHERMAVQQGLFLCPCDIAKSFVENLAASLGKQPRDLEDTNSNEISLDNLVAGYKPGKTNVKLPPILKIVLPFNLHDDTMRDLEQMNITAASLFPGLDGFARSLRQEYRKYRFVLPTKFR